MVKFNFSLLKKIYEYVIKDSTNPCVNLRAPNTTNNILNMIKTPVLTRRLIELFSERLYLEFNTLTYNRDLQSFLSIIVTDCMQKATMKNQKIQIENSKPLRTLREIFYLNELIYHKLYFNIFPNNPTKQIMHTILINYVPLENFNISNNLKELRKRFKFFTDLANNLLGLCIIEYNETIADEVIFNNMKQVLISYESIMHFIYIAKELSIDIRHNETYNLVYYCDMEYDINTLKNLYRCEIDDEYKPIIDIENIIDSTLLKKVRNGEYNSDTYKNMVNEMNSKCVLPQKGRKLAKNQIISIITGDKAFIPKVDAKNLSTPFKSLHLGNKQCFFEANAISQLILKKELPKNSHRFPSCKWSRAVINTLTTESILHRSNKKKLLQGIKHKALVDAYNKIIAPEVFVINAVFTFSIKGEEEEEEEEEEEIDLNLAEHIKKNKEDVEHRSYSSAKSNSINIVNIESKFASKENSITIKIDDLNINIDNLNIEKLDEKSSDNNLSEKNEYKSSLLANISSNDFTFNGDKINSSLNVNSFQSRSNIFGSDWGTKDDLGHNKTNKIVSFFMEEPIKSSSSSQILPNQTNLPTTYKNYNTKLKKRAFEEFSGTESRK